MYNTKNYTEQGGDVTHIGGKLVFDEGAEGVMPNQAAATGSMDRLIKSNLKE